MVREPVREPNNDVNAPPSGGLTTTGPRAKWVRWQSCTSHLNSKRSVSCSCLMRGPKQARASKLIPAGPPSWPERPLALFILDRLAGFEHFAHTKRAAVMRPNGSPSLTTPSHLCLRFWLVPSQSRSLYDIREALRTKG